jgi:hypothetical protein
VPVVLTPTYFHSALEEKDIVKVMSKDKIK